MEEKEKWEELIRSKIYDFEADTDPGDWEALAEKLRGGKIIRLNFLKKLTYTVSAAAVIALLIVGGMYLFSDKNSTSDLLIAVDNTFQQNSENAIEAAEKEPVPDEIPVENAVNNLLAATVKPEKKVIPAALLDIKEEPPATLTPLFVDDSKSTQIPDTDTAEISAGDAIPNYDQEIMLLDKPLLATNLSETKRRRWSFGMGGGGYTVNSTTGGMSVTTTSRVIGEEEFMRDGNSITLRNGMRNATLFDPIDGLDNNSELGKVKHQTPLSAGLGVGYHLNDRWSLQSGVVYTLLRSKGSYMDEVGNIGERKRYLHFLGIPLSASYKIAEWKRIHFYASAGGMGEWNFAGRRKEIMIVENLETVDCENIRMKELLWSVHTRAGAVYPLWKFVNIYAETGVSYYFDNKSAIETVRSDKPFNLSIQAGIRLGF